MTPEQLESVAKALYEVEYSNSWHDAPQSVQAEYIGLAQTAALLLSESFTFLHPSYTSEATQPPANKIRPPYC